jgi:GMP reductase
MQIINEVKLDFDDVLIRPKRSEMGSRAEIELNRTFRTLNSQQELTGVPIIAANMDVVGTMAMSRALSAFGIFTCLHKFYPPDKLIQFFKQPESAYTFYTLGITENDISKLKSVREYTPISNICIDAANGYSKYFSDRVKELRDMMPSAVIMAGNVATPEMVQELLIGSRADIIKIGIGPGSVCETRKVTGCGYYQLSAVIECADSAHGLGGHICSDGGCKTSGDVCKAFGAGSDFVMLGGMLAGHDECEGEWEEEFVTKTEIISGKEVPSYNINGDLEKKKVALKFYGMSSREAQEKYYGGLAEHRAAEGKCVSVPYKGAVKDTVQHILGGIRSACTYVGASKLKDLSKCTTFVKNK